MIDLVRRRIGLRLFLIFTAVLCFCIFCVVALSAVFYRDFGKSVIAENERYVTTEALNFLSEITGQRAEKYEATFQKLSAWSRLIARQAELRFEFPGEPAGKPLDVASYLSVRPPSGNFFTDLSAPAVICYWGGPSIPPAVAGEIRLLAPLAPVLAEAKEKNPEVAASHLIMTSGVGHYYPNTEKVFLLPPVSELDLRDTNNYVLANPRNNPTRQTVWVPVYNDDIGLGLITTVTSPIYAGNGDFKGVAGLDIPLARIHQQILRDSELEERGLVSFLLDERGKIISFPMERLGVFGIESATDAFKNSLDLLDKGLIDSSLPEIKALGEKLLTTPTQTSRFRLRGEPYIVSSKLMPTNRWRLVSVIPEAAFLAPVTAIETTLFTRMAGLKYQFYLTALLFLVGSLGLTLIFLRKYFLQPLQQVAAAAEQIRGGDLQARLAIDRIDEIGMLARSFNVMAESLHQSRQRERDYATELECQVAVQTEELQRQKQVLELALEELEADIRHRQQVEVELIQTKEAAEAANRAKANFLANMTHELRTPLIGVLGMNELLLDTPLDEGQRKLADTVRRSGEVLLAMVSDILDFSKIDSGHLRLCPVAADFAGIVEETVQLLEGPAAEKGLALSCRIAPEARQQVLADPLRLRQILLNLVSNAVKFTARGEVVVRLDRTTKEGADRYLLEIADTGIGMEPADLERIFAPFVQIDSTATRAFGGTGLGLAIVRQLVGLMGGELGVESQPGKGSRFRVSLPLSAAPPVGAEAFGDAGETPAPLCLSGSERILVADDYAVTRELVRQLLAIEGLTIDEAASGREVLTLVAANDYGLILMDCNMPELDGMETTRRLRQQGCLTPIVALTAHVDSRIYQECQEAGMNDHLPKPFRRRELQAMVDKWLPGPVAE